MQEKKAQKEQERGQRIAEGEAEAAIDNPRLREREKLTSLLSPLGMEIKDIPSDGHCLYAAIADQLSLRLGAKVNDTIYIRYIILTMLCSLQCILLYTYNTVYVWL